MNESTPPPVPPFPSNVSPAAPVGGPPAPPSNEQAPITGLTSAVEVLLREPRRMFCQLGQPGGGVLIRMLLAITVACGLVYGVIVGSFSGDTQLWAAPVKIALGLLASALICLPSLFIFACLGGSTLRLREVVGLLAGKLALTTILLIGFAPVAWIFSESTQSLAMMAVLHLGFWLVALLFGVRFLRAGFAPRVQSTFGINLWIVIYLLVALQMTTALRPLLGTAPTFLPIEKKFFLHHWSDTLDGHGTQRP